MQALLLVELVIVSVPAPAWQCLDIRCLHMQTGLDPVHPAALRRPKARSLSEELINCFAEEEKLCEHIHLPVQSGSNRVLALMNRGYKVDEYMKKVDHLRKVCPQISITSDIIVGFPGETQKDYQETKQDCGGDGQILSGPGKEIPHHLH